MITQYRYRMMQRSQLRVIMIELTRLPIVLESLKSPIIIFTVFETMRNVQVFRFDRAVDAALEQAVLIPGIASNMSILITIGVKEDHNTYTLVGQAHFALRDLSHLGKKKDYTMHFVQKIQV